MADGNRGKGPINMLNPVQTAAARELMAQVCFSYKILAQASEAVRACERVHDAADRKVLEEAADYWRLNFENEVDCKLEELCEALGMSYASAREMAVDVVGEHG